MFSTGGVFTTRRGPLMRLWRKCNGSSSVSQVSRNLLQPSTFLPFCIELRFTIKNPQYWLKFQAQFLPLQSSIVSKCPRFILIKNFLTVSFRFRRVADSVLGVLDMSLYETCPLPSPLSESKSPTRLQRYGTGGRDDVQQVRIEYSE